MSLGSVDHCSGINAAEGCLKYQPHAVSSPDNDESVKTQELFNAKLKELQEINEESAGSIKNKCTEACTLADKLPRDYRLIAFKRICVVLIKQGLLGYDMRVWIIPSFVKDKNEADKALFAAYKETAQDYLNEGEVKKAIEIFNMIPINWVDDDFIKLEDAIYNAYSKSIEDSLKEGNIERAIEIAGLIPLSSCQVNSFNAIADTCLKIVKGYLNVGDFDKACKVAKLTPKVRDHHHQQVEASVAVSEAGLKIVEDSLAKGDFDNAVNVALSLPFICHDHKDKAFAVISEAYEEYFKNFEKPEEEDLRKASKLAELIKDKIPDDQVDKIFEGISKSCEMNCKISLNDGEINKAIEFAELIPLEKLKKRMLSQISSTCVEIVGNPLKVANFEEAIEFAMSIADKEINKKVLRTICNAPNNPVDRSSKYVNIKMAIEAAKFIPYNEIRDKIFIKISKVCIESVEDFLKIKDIDRAIEIARLIPDKNIREEALNEISKVYIEKINEYLKAKKYDKAMEAAKLIPLQDKQISAVIKIEWARQGL